MKASIRRRYVLPNQIKVENIEKPVPKDNEVQVKIKATTVNRKIIRKLSLRIF